ncbi:MULTISPECIES: UDP-N-acetylmuramoyl-L-alanyl-D-glutamate--2,6-diaminopimelate ligase [Flavobacterium]|uniref:UDP-N-acetylmuramoyl-L-alanyl-D-glutamate--2, 6-diaminopimelate ligase n=1 Tax=Flavobacterium TaxID=237 RepID=UPI000745CE85|nr:UDP-N-acetylmuramoyl-L-alanyl-D-glutamate--2,6-diaminopimelate ligase [Flavobacterium covae]AMA50027.1 UDP-N-acetylmuramoyl-L-alanyl-D-glutamate--2,6-diaminopimelate ligase [Flavobacterium covae]AND64443.1 UDP-N-acetylmuramoyl-L-alanyl-D-glutamate--2,6-diaminopimelate ligase [Flavobacterium covae]MCJ1805577.1 UDP-N-acetylmuramoyl-L-alanyl-D-glutamate--2,6-diaminopimelate ligase [Flavobacterium covae]MCJ1808660.1 UDP-N-acetylmuramoyl-L-alanyl-D-glutamate--2,6-diaminopimelate ligase [Flavobact
MNLKDLLYKVPIEEVQGSTTKTVNQIHFDSRKIETNDIFVAIRGTLSDGHQYIEKAISLGATTIICEQLPKTCLKNITYIKVQDTNTALAQLANNFYEKPSNKLILVGVTGTNGKTTIASLLYQMFKRAGYKVGLLSTVKIMVNTTEYKATHTTPDSLTINYFLNQMVQEGCEYCFMEVSSHGVHQKRTEGLFFAGGVFTNLSHDHLDYHPTFAEYRDVKKMFFDHLPKTAFALTNIDDKNGSVMLQNTQARKKTYALKTYADYKAVILENQLSGLQLKINEQDVWTRLIGTFNAYNLLAIYAVAVELGIDKIEALRLLSELESVSGRFQFIVSKEKITTIVDYAHTPDALENVLNTINDIRTKNEQLITIVGCGGDRDRTKRPVMARIATEMSSKVILTSDNPRTENPQAIIEEMEAGITAENFKKYVSIIDRKQAIKTACQIAENGDIILIAGKGHETYQEVNGIRHDFDDMKIVQELLKQLNK